MNPDLVQVIVMLVIFVIITAVGSYSLYRAGRPGWWLPIVFFLIVFGWPFVKPMLG